MEFVIGSWQILNAEEEIKRRNCGMTRPSGLLQGDITTDSVLMTRHTTPRTGSEANLGGDMEGAEAEDASNQNAHSRHMLRMSSMSPSSESPLRRATYFQHNVVTYTSITISFDKLVRISFMPLLICLKFCLFLPNYIILQDCG